MSLDSSLYSSSESRSPFPSSITIVRPDDWHVHVRDGAMMKAVLPFTAEVFGRGIIMPNLLPPITTTQMAREYRLRIMELLPHGSTFHPLMTAYLTDKSDPDEIERGFGEQVFAAAKLYPAHATTNSAHGVTDIAHIMGVLERMAEISMPLLVHGEVTDPMVDIFDRESVFIERVLHPLIERLPELKIVMEHITTSDAASFVRSSGANIAATITPHHLVLNRNDLFKGGLRPHAYCLPVAKQEQDRVALAKAATSGNPKFFLGTDSAPHHINDKERDCGCAGIFCAPVAMAIYTRVFEEEDALHHLEAFASLNGARFYDMPPNDDTITLVRKTWQVPPTIQVEDVYSQKFVQPFLAREQLEWQVEPPR